MPIHSQTPESRRADSLADDGEYKAASRFAARSARARLERFGVESHANCDMAVGDLLFAIYFARRARESQTAIRYRGTLETYVSTLQEAAYLKIRDLWPNFTGACLVGLFEEWVGDAYLFTEPGGAIYYYDRAEPWYRGEECRATDEFMKEIPCWGWGAEPQFFKTLRVFFDFLEWREPEIRDEWSVSEYDTWFFDRLDDKRRLAKRWARSE